MKQFSLLPELEFVFQILSLFQLKSLFFMERGNATARREEERDLLFWGRILGVLLLVPKRHFAWNQRNHHMDQGTLALFGCVC